MFIGLIIVGIVTSKELHWIGFLIGGGLFFFCLSAATGLLQTVRLHINLFNLLLVWSLILSSAVRPGRLYVSLYGYSSCLHLLQVNLGLRHSLLCLGLGSRPWFP